MFPYEEPHLITDPALLNILEELRRHELIFHHPEHGTTRADFDSMMEHDFVEVGASGRRYTREYALGVLEKRVLEGCGDDRLEVTDCQCRRLAEEVYLLTYTLLQGERKTRRTSIWRRSETGWKIVFHQGTIVQDS